MITPVSEILKQRKSHKDYIDKIGLDNLIKRFNSSLDFYSRGFDYCQVPTEVAGMAVNLKTLTSLIKEISNAGYYVVAKRNMFAPCGFLVKAYFEHPKNWWDKMCNYND